MSLQVAIRLELLRSAPLNSWIALSEEESEIVAVGATYSEVEQRCEEAGVSDPIVLKTPEMWAAFCLVSACMRN